MQGPVLPEQALARQHDRRAIAPARAGAIARLSSRLRVVPLLPAVLFVFVVTQIPFVLTIVYSLYSWNLLIPGAKQFAGFSNYITVLGSDSFRIAIRNTVILTTCAVVFSVILGLTLALLLDRKFLGRSIVRTILIAPFLVMPTASALVWKTTLLSPIFGIVDYLIGHEIDWVNRFPLPTIIAFTTWQYTPFTMLIILAGLQSQNLEIVEAARIDGAGPVNIFRYITLPALRPYIELASLLGSIFIIQTFDPIYMMTQGGPAQDTTNIPFLLYLVAFQGFDIGQASAIGVISVFLTMIVATAALRTLFSLFRMDLRT